MALAAIGPIVQSEIAAGHVPGAVVLVGHQGRIVYRAAFGAALLSPRYIPLQTNQIFDLASLTKVIATTTAIMQLTEAGRVRLDDPVAGYWPEFGFFGKNTITIRQLLTHTSGLRPDFRRIDHWSGKTGAWAQIDFERPVSSPGSEFIYSDLNFIALGALIEKITGEPLDVYARRHIFAPIGMRDTAFHLSPRQRAQAVPTDVEQGMLRQGEVQDPTAFRMGGVAGHAGLFSTARDLARFATMLLQGGRFHGARILQPKTVALMTTPERLPGGGARGLGWDMSSAYAGGLGAPFGPRAFGHTGYTGTALWIDPTTGSFVIILASRLYPNDRGDARPLRARIAELVAAAFRPPVLPGIDVLEDEHFAPLIGKNLGLLTNRTGRDIAGQRTIDQLANAPGVSLRVIFTPEHGLEADREGRIASGRDRATKLPIASLYGATTRPTGEMLRGLDALVIDLQDAGTRYFTYPTTVAYLLQAAATNGTLVYLLDRPDPIDAGVVEGPVLDPALRSFTGYAPMPVRPGMTLGELAKMFNAEDHLGAKLHVVAMQGYDRGRWYNQTGLAWINPSPNLRSVTEATLYPGVGMIEGANVSVGRGTATPFELLGAPWIDGNRLARYLTHRDIAGVRLVRADFIPSSDRYAGQHCHGVRISLIDRDHFDAALFGLELAAALHRLYPRQFQLRAITSLVGSRRLVAAIAAGADPRTLPSLWQDDLAAFRAIRARYLLY